MDCISCDLMVNNQSMIQDRVERTREIRRRCERKRLQREKAVGMTHGTFAVSKPALNVLDRLRDRLSLGNRGKAVNHVLERLAANPALQKEFGLVDK